MALACKAFGWQQPGSGLDWSLVEEAARQAACSNQNNIEGVRIGLPQYGGTTSWLSILHESEHPLKFDTLSGGYMEYGSDGKTSVRRTQNGVGTAVASNYIMESGIHYAEFQITAGIPYIGIVRPMTNLDPDRFVANGVSFHFFIRAYYCDYLAARTDEWGKAMCMLVNTPVKMAKRAGQTGTV